VSHPPSDTNSAARVAALLRDLGSQLRRGGAPSECPTGGGRRFPTGIPDLDELLGGGFQPGQLGEIAGPPSSGRTSVALALLAHTTGAGEVAALVDGTDSFDPGSAEAAGVALDRVLWVRAPGLLEALRSTERLLGARGFALVVLDLAIADLRTAPAAWPRLARAAAGTDAALVLLSARRQAGTSAALAVELKPTRAHFTGTPALLEGLEIEAALVRHRSAPALRSASLRLRASQAA
jgi:RecA/RadA recombinase